MTGDSRIVPAAGMIALAGNLTGDTTLMAVALIAQLVALTAAVAELRQAQQHAAQAAAARAAAAHLNAAVTQARSRAPRFGSFRMQQPTREASAARVARLDFPMPVKPAHAAGSDAETRHPRCSKRRPPLPGASPHH